MKIELLRGIFIAGEPHPAGAQIDVPDSLARELIATNKAQPATADVAVPATVTTDTAAALVRGKKAEA